MDAAPGGEADPVDPAPLAYQVFGERFPCALLLLGSDLEIEWATPTAGAVLGYCDGALIGRSVAELLHPEDLDRIAPMIAAVLSRADEAVAAPTAAMGIEVAARVADSDGHYRPMAVSGRIVDTTGRVLVLVRPASERHALDRVLDGLAHGADLDRVLDALVGLARAQFGVGAAWILHDLDGVLETVGTSSDPGIGSGADLLDGIRGRGPSGAPMIDDHRWIAPVRSATGETLYGVLVLPSPRSDGPMPFDLHVLDRSVSLASLAFARAVDDRLLRLAASTDPLTGVLNRREFESRLARSALRPEDLPLSVFFVDVDRFKAINDAHGHAVGDETLVAVASRLAATVRGHDSVGRLGGDEFAVSCPGLAGPTADAMRDRLRSAFVEPIALQDLRVELSVTIGVATATDETSLERVVDRSDADMYDRKHRTRAATLS